MTRSHASKKNRWRLAVALSPGRSDGTWAVRAICLAGLACLVAACGGDDGATPPPPGPPQRPGGGPASTAPAAAPASQEGPAFVFVPNPRWNALSSYFDRFLQEPPGTQRDPFRNFITSHVARPELPEEPAPGEEGVEGEGAVVDVVDTESTPVEPPVEPIEEEAQSPLQRYAVDEYKLLLIMSGTVVPKAVIEDPIGNTWIVKRDTQLGNKGGVVESITQYAVIVREPDVDNPVEKTVRPLIFEAAPSAAAGPSNDVFGAERLTGPPL